MSREIGLCKATCVKGMPVIIREVLLLVLKEHPQDSISGQGRSLLGHTAYELQHKKKTPVPGTGKLEEK